MRKKIQSRRQRFQTPVNYKKYFKIAGSIFFTCLILAAIIFLFGLANSYLMHRNHDPLVVPAGSIVDLPDFENKLKRVGVPYQQIEVATNGASIIVYINEDTVAYLDPVKDVQWQVSSLQQILNQLTIENKKPQYIDLRYDKPIVKF